MHTEFSRPVKAGHIHGAPQSYELAADEQTRAALAARFSLPGIAVLTGVFVLSHHRGGIIAADLVMKAQVTQLCVITLEPFEAGIEERVALHFVPAEKLADEEEMAPESLDGPDEIPYQDDVIDLGEALAEQLALALDPYPRKPGAELPPEASDDGANPFSALRAKLGKPV
jgi:uncharacterized metal-binding protein YceD (DUF177 family)